MPTEPQSGVGVPGTGVIECVMGAGKQTQVLARAVYALSL